MLHMCMYMYMHVYTCHACLYMYWLPDLDGGAWESQRCMAQCTLVKVLQPFCLPIILWCLIIANKLESISALYVYVYCSWIFMRVPDSRCYNIMQKIHDTDTICRFTEMPTNNFIESSFWNFDALFQPQQHPARDAHDTFFLKGYLALLSVK